MRVSLLALLMVIAGCGATGTSVTPTPGEPPAPDFQMTGLDGNSYQLSELRGQWVLVNFWATWCVPCVEEMPALQAAADTWADELQVLGVNQRESAESVQAFVDEHGIRFPILLNPGDQVLIAYQVVGLPQTLLIDPTGQMVFRQFGPLELDALDALLRGWINSG